MMTQEIPRQTALRLIAEAGREFRQLLAEGKVTKAGTCGLAFTYKKVTGKDQDEQIKD